jgi:hypothetical protein
MRQVISRTKYNVAWGDEVGYMNFAGDGNSVTGPPSTTLHSIPMPVAGVFRNLAVIAQAAHSDITVTFVVNAVETALTVFVDSADTYASDEVNQVSVDVGDLVQLKYTAATAIANGYDLGFAIEFEGAQHWYGINKDDRTLTDGVSMAGGALGNGFFVLTNAGSGTLTNTRSLNALDGTITGLYLHSYTGAPASGNLTAYVKLNSITQDGTGGTVNTGAVLASGSGVDFATSTFSLPIEVGDHVEYQVRRSGGSVTSTVSGSLTFTPTNPLAPFMCCGGSGVLVNPHMWNQNEQLADLPNCLSTLGPQRVTLTGFACEVTTPGTGNTYTYTIVANGTPTALTTTIEPDESLGLTEGVNVAFLPDQSVVIDADTGGGNYYWGLAAVVGSGDAPPTTAARVIRRLRRFPLPNEELFYLFVSELQLYAQVGVGTSTGQGANPIVMCRYSVDGGATWSNERQLSVGAIGRYLTRARIVTLGRGRDWVVEFTQTDPVFTAWLDCYAQITKGTR